MGKGSLLGDPPGSAGSPRQQAMGEKLTDQVKGNGCPAKMDGCINNGGSAGGREVNARVGRAANTTFRANERRGGGAIHPEGVKDAVRAKLR